MTLRALLDARAPIDQFATYLDALPPDARRDEVNALGRGDQALLFDIAADAGPIRLAHFVPDDVAAGTPVHHPGRNTIGVPAHFQRFEKRFVKPSAPEHRGLLAGYNASNAFFVHPGYYLAYETDGARVAEDQEPSRTEWVRRGGVVVDYFQVPEGWPLPSGWPPVRPNSVGIQRFVYDRTRDFMRRVSAHVSIGRASTQDDKGDRELDYWFTLVRDPTPSEPKG